MRLAARHRRTAYALLGAVWLSGAAWLLGHYGLAAAGAFGPAEHPLAGWSLRAHGVLVYALLLLVGSLLPGHVRLAWAMRRNRRSGGLMVSWLLWLAGSGLWLYYGGLAGRDAVSLAHWATGLALAPLLALHVWRGRASRPLP